MFLWKRIKKAFNNYLVRLEKVNKEQFGNGRLDCCDFNKKKSEK